MKPRISPTTVTIGLVAILCGLVSAYIVRRYMEPPLPADTRVNVVVPRFSLPKYNRIGDQHLQVVKMEPENVPEGAITSPERALYRTTREAILAGEPILDQLLYAVGETPTLAEQLPAGLRAVTIAVDRVNALGGLVIPESFVDIALTVNSGDRRLGGTVTKTIMERVLVLATSEQRFPSEERLEPSFRSVTVAVTPEQANQLILSQRHGILSITLRSGHDTDLASEFPSSNLVNLASLLGLPASDSQHVEIWRGVNASYVTFGAQGANLSPAAAAQLAPEPASTDANPTYPRDALANRTR